MTDPGPTPPQDYIRWLRSKIGHQLTYLVYAAVVLFDEEGRILAQQRADFDAWGLPGGAMEVGEALLTTAHREILEETRLEVDIKGLVGLYTHPKYTIQYPNGDLVQQWSACLWGHVTDGAMVADGEETLDVFWTDPETFMQRTFPAPRDMVRDALRVYAGEPMPLEPVETPGPLQNCQARLRKHVGHAPLILPGSSAMVENEQGHVLATFRADFNCWDLPSGYQELGETSTANIVREVLEETGLVVEPYALTGLYTDPCWYYVTYRSGDVVHAVGPTFACHVTGGELVASGADTENLAVAFVPVNELLDNCCGDTTRQMLRDYLDRDGWPHMR